MVGRRTPTLGGRWLVAALVAARYIRVTPWRLYDGRIGAPRLPEGQATTVAVLKPHGIDL